jgi:hypothetical protein
VPAVADCDWNSSPRRYLELLIPRAAIGNGRALGCRWTQQQWTMQVHACILCVVACRRPRRARRGKPSLELASKPPIVEPESSSAPIAIDWSKEAELAVSRQIDADEEAARKARAFSAPTGLASLAAAPAPNPQFGWSHARTHRVESMPGEDSSSISTISARSLS